MTPSDHVGADTALNLTQPILTHFGPLSEIADQSDYVRGHLVHGLDERPRDPWQVRLPEVEIRPLEDRQHAYPRAALRPPLPSKHLPETKLDASPKDREGSAPRQ